MSTNLFCSIILNPLIESFSRYGDKNAFCIADIYYPYSSFREYVYKIRRLVHDFPSESHIVGIAIHNDIETYAGIIALWMEGKAFVPLNPDQPLFRNEAIIRQVEISELLDSNESSVFSDICNSIIRISHLDSIDEYCEPVVNYSDELLVYLLFTSGSTGEPKGVQLSRGNLAAFMDSFWCTGIKINETDRCFQLFDLTFDVSIQSFLAPLLRGACVFTVPYGQVKYICAASLFRKYNITFGAMAPSMLSYLRPYFSELDLSSFKCGIITAEACNVDLIEDWMKYAVNSQMYDFYGPTEATIYCTYYKVPRNIKPLSHNGIVSIGTLMKNVNAIIIDEDGKQVKKGEMGELCISGKQLSKGYWNNPQKNELSFFDKGGKVYYHTGDLCYIGPEDNILYVGRIDLQAKIQGFRVEMGEIEYHARNYYKNNRRVAAVAFTNQKNLSEIALFIESNQESSKELYLYLKHRLPQYMLPNKIIYLPEFPLNKSEKIDRKALLNSLL